MTVRIVPLPPEALRALADGDRAAAEAASPVPLGGFLTGPSQRGLWARRARQVAEHPDDGAWITGVIWTGEVAVGRAGFHGAPDADGLVEVGYAVDPEHRRRGHARAALELLLDRAARDQAVRTVRASISPDNAASRALVAGYGFVPVGEQWDDEDGLETIFEVAAVHRWRTTVRALVLHPTEPLLLDVPPELELPGRVQLPDMLGAFRDRGLDLVALAEVREDADSDTLRGEVLLLTGLRGPEPAGARWVPPADDVVAALVRRATAPGEEPVQPWLRRDWLPAAEAWLRTVAEPTGPVVQHKVWDLSAVLSVPTAAGSIWLKSTVAAPLFADEARVTVALDRLFPGQVPRAVAVEPDRGWLALADFGPELGWQAPVADREEALRRFARLQQASVPHLVTLRAAGVRDRGLGWLAGELPGRFRADALRRFEPGIADELAAAVPRLVALCEELAKYGVPDTLLHGDLHLGNVARGPDGGMLFFDWTDAAVGHPFVDVIAAGQGGSDAVRARLRDAYLAEWDAGLAGAWPVAEVLAAANQAVSYLSLEQFLRGDRPDPLFGSFTGDWFRLVLDRLRAC